MPATEVLKLKILYMCRNAGHAVAVRMTVNSYEQAVSSTLPNRPQVDPAMLDIRKRKLTRR